MRSASAWTSVASGAVERRGRRVHGLPVGAALPDRGVEALLGHGRERLAQAEVQVHRAVRGGVERPAGQRAVVDRGLAPGVVVSDLHEPPDRAAVDLHLVDRLPGADLAQLGRAVGGEHDQRHARLAGLGHGGQQVGRGGAGGAGDRHRAVGGLGHAEGEEAGGALVDHRRGLGQLGQGEGEGRVARAGRGDRVAQPAAHQLVDEGPERRIGAVHRDSGGVAAPLVVFVPGFMQRGEAWAPVADLLSQRYSSVLLDHAEHDREGRLREIAEAAGTGGAVLCGYSLGGRLSLQAALREPSRYRGLVTLGPPPGWSPRPTASSARTPTSSWPRGWSAHRSRRSWTCGSASRCSPTSPRC